MKIVRNLEQGSEEWLELRAWVITWTQTKRILWTSSVRLNYIYELIGEKIAPIKQEWFVSPAMERWKILEKVLKETRYTEYKDVSFIFWSKERYWYSPDWVLFSDNSETEIREDIEIKCPESKNFVKYYIEGKIPDEYFDQIIFAFVVNPNLEKRKVVIYNPDVFDKSIAIKEIIVKREDYFAEIEEMIIALKTFRSQRLDTFNLLIK